MAILSYNGIVIPYCNTVKFDHRAVYDDSNTDLVCIKFDVEVNGYLHLDYLGHIFERHLKGRRLNGPADLYQSLGVAGIVKMIRSRLLQPRREFHFWVNGVDMIPQSYDRDDETNTARYEYIPRPPFFRVVRPAATGQAGLGTPVANPEGRAGATDFAQALKNIGHVDAKNGPHPQACNITRLTDTMFAVSFSIEAHYVESRKDSNVLNTLGHDIISNRWTETISIDRNQYTTRTRQGSFLLRSDAAFKPRTDSAPQGYIPYLANLGIPPGFVRESSQYTLSPDGLGISYTITDKEYFKQPPGPAFEADGSYTEKLGTCGVIRHAQSNVKLKSSKLVRQSILVARAIAIVLTKMTVRGLRFGSSTTSPTAASSFLEYLNYTVDLYENEVSVQAGALLPGLVGSAGDLSDYDRMDRTGLCWTPLSDAARPASIIDSRFFFDIEGSGPEAVTAPPRPLYRTWPGGATAAMGSASLLFASAAYWDPALRNVFLEQTSAGTGSVLGQITPTPADAVRRGAAPLPVPGFGGLEEELVTF